MERRSWALTCAGMHATGVVGVGLSLIVLVLSVGCGKQGAKSDGPGGKSSSNKSMADEYRAGMAEQKAEAEAPAKKAPPEPPPAPKLPEVKMPATLAETCLVKVGDTMPDVELADLGGKRMSLQSLLGKRLSVVLFWQSDSVYATQALEYLQLDVAVAFAEKGVRVVGVNVKDSPEAARKAVEESGAKYANLLDPEGAYFAKVATERIPRVYLLDAGGKVLWFDTEYSSTTRRDLERAIQFVLGGK